MSAATSSVSRVSGYYCISGVSIVILFTLRILPAPKPNYTLSTHQFTKLPSFDLTFNFGVTSNTMCFSFQPVTQLRYPVLSFAALLLHSTRNRCFSYSPEPALSALQAYLDLTDHMLAPRLILSNCNMQYTSLTLICLQIKPLLPIKNRKQKTGSQASEKEKMLKKFSNKK